MSTPALTTTNLPSTFPLVSRGKVRDIYHITDSTLLFVATDRISAFDVILRNGIPGKGKLLTLLSVHWFAILSARIPDLRHHFLTLALPAGIPPERAGELHERAMQVRRVRVFPVEAIVRGYITGSAWKEYQASGTVHGMQIPAGLSESDAFPGGAIYTPSTKAEAGEADENIHPDRAAEILGAKYATRIADLALTLYQHAHTYALARGIIIADTKFEFGLDPRADEVVLVDEVLTPDSSRFWPVAAYRAGRPQESFDKQLLRDWLVAEGLKGKAGVEIPDAVVRRTQDKYQEAFRRLVLDDP